MPKAAHVYPAVNVALEAMVCMSGRGSQMPVGTVLRLRVSLCRGLCVTDCSPAPRVCFIPSFPVSSSDPFSSSVASVGLQGPK